MAAVADDLVARLRRGGVLRADEEAAAMRAAPGEVEALLARRLAGEPLARILGHVEFCGLRLRLDADVYVPRWTSEFVARAAAERLPDGGVAVDLCTGCGAVAAHLATSRPGARVVAVDLHPPSVACARSNGVDAVVGDLFDPLPPDLVACLDVVVSVAPFVPSEALGGLAADVVAHERVEALDGGPGGLVLVDRIARDGATWLAPGAALVVELAPYQSEDGRRLLGSHGYVGIDDVVDDDGDVCGLVARRPGPP